MTYGIRVFSVSRNGNVAACTKYTRTAIRQQKMALGKQIDAEMQERYRIDGFANKKEKLAAETAQEDKYNKRIEPSRESINYYNKGAIYIKTLNILAINCQVRTLSVLLDTT